MLTLPLDPELRGQIANALDAGAIAVPLLMLGHAWIGGPLPRRETLAVICAATLLVGVALLVQLT